MARESITELHAEVLTDESELSLGELCRACEVSAERVLALVEEGVIEPEGPEAARWRFRAVSIRRVRWAVRLQRDLGVNPAGAALAVDLLEELEALRERLRRFDV